MVEFAFISDEDLRASLISDYRELDLSLNHGAWKATHVLAGSIVEAMLVDYLLTSKYAQSGSKDPLKMDLAGLILECKAADILSEQTEHLSTVIRGYRNLIHAGRIVRLREKIDESTAQVAKALVDIIVKEVETKTRLTKRNTAEQVLDKIEQDPSALAFIGHFITDMKPSEMTKLLIRLMPARYFYYLDKLPKSDPFEGTTPREKELWKKVSALQDCFNAAYEMAPDTVKVVVTKNFIRILLEESEAHVLAYELHCFQCTELRHLSEDEIKIVKSHLLRRFGEQPVVACHMFFKVIAGLGQYLTPQESAELAESMCHTLHNGIDWPVEVPIWLAEAIHVEYAAMSSEAKLAFENGWATYINMLIGWDEEVVSREMKRLKLQWKSMALDE